MVFQSLTETTPTRMRALRAVATLTLAVLALTSCGGRSLEETTDIANDASASRFDRCMAMNDLADEGAAAVETLHALASDPNPKVARCATESLADVRGRGAVLPLVALLADKDPAVVVGATTALGRIGDGRSARRLAELVGRRDPRIVAAAVKALERVADPRAIPPLNDLVSRRDPRTVAVAVRALGGIDDPRAVRPLQRAAVRGLTASGPDPAWRKVRFTAVFALGELRDPRAEDTLLRVMRSDPRHSDVAGRALTKTFAHDVGHLLPLLQDPQNIKIAYALVDLGRRGTEDELATALHSYGDLTLAEYYLNCGNRRLEGAARDWAYARGYTVTTVPGMGGNQWGSGL